MSSFITKQDGYYELGSMGYVACVVILVLAILLIAFLADKKQEGKKFSIRQVAFSGLALALGFVASYIKIYDPPFGGSVTLFSMLFVSKYEEEWDIDNADLKDNYVFAMVENLTDPWCSDMGSIKVESMFGGLVRTA